MSFPDQPPEPDFSWPPKWEDWMWSFIEWCKARQPIPNPSDFDVSEAPFGVMFSLSQQGIAAIRATPFRLQLVDASSGGTPKVRVRLGYVAGRKADTGMADPSDSPVFKLTLASALATKYIECKVTVAYDAGTGIWSSSACALQAVSSPTASAATHIYVQIGAVSVVSNGSGGYKVAPFTPQTVTGDQWVARIGNATTYVDANGIT
jgi:hypothetical protein